MQITHSPAFPMRHLRPLSCVLLTPPSFAESQWQSNLQTIEQKEVACGGVHTLPLEMWFLAALHCCTGGVVGLGTAWGTSGRAHLGREFQKPCFNAGLSMKKPALEAIFGMDLLHTTVPNGTQSFRLSCDTRWQPLEAPWHTSTLP